MVDRMDDACWREARLTKPANDVTKDSMTRRFSFFAQSSASPCSSISFVFSSEETTLCELPEDPLFFADKAQKLKKSSEERKVRRQ